MTVTLVLLASLTAAAEPNWSSRDYMNQALEFTRYRTDPTTWAADGALGLRWGMGPGDVKSAARGLEYVFADSGVALGQSASVDDTINGFPVTVHYAFLRGRLYEVLVNTASRRVGSDHSMEGLKQFWEQAWKWRRSLVSTLESSLGKPVCSPSEWTLSRFCDRVAPPPGCGPHDMDRIDRLFRWVWRNGRTETVVLGGPAPRLVYSDLTMVRAVERAKQQASAEFQARQAAAKEAEVRRLTGAPGVAPPEPLPSTAQHVDDSRDAEPPPLECVADPDEPSAESTNDKGSWSHAGWSRFRWGMGPADVRSALMPVQASQAIWSAGRRERASLLVPSDQAFGAEVSTRFSFDKDRLTAVEQTRTCSGLPGAPAAECVAWAKRIEDGFSGRLGASRCTRDGKYVRCNWNAGRSEWSRLTRYAARDFQTVTVFYGDPKNAPKNAPPSVVKTSTPQKSWSKQGWFGFQWAMGVADVQRRLSAPNGEFRAKRELACIEEEDGDVDCTLERDFHAFSIVSLKPTLSFSFTDGRLTYVSVVFPKYLEEAAFAEASQNLKALLVAKYGAGRSGGDDKDRDKGYTSIDWELDEMRVSYWASRTGRESSLFVSYASTVTRRELKGSEGDKRKL